MISARTVVRDAIAGQFQTFTTCVGEVRPDVAVSLRWLQQQEVKQSATVCVVVTDEQREPMSHQADGYAMQVLTVLYARHAQDPRAELDDMVEYAVKAVLVVMEQLKRDHVIWKAALDTISTDEGSSEAGPWAQAVLRWSVSHQRKAVVG